MRYMLNATSDYGKCLVTDQTVTFVADNDYENAFFKIELDLPDFDDSTFLMMPSSTTKTRLCVRASKH